MKILIIEDEKKLAQGLKKLLEQEGYAADYLLDGEAGQTRIGVHHVNYDLVILDVMLPQKSGFEILRYMRQKDIATPVLMLTAKDTTDDKIFGLNSGADDYLVKPFSSEELLARVKTLLRRPKQSLPQTLKVGNIMLDPVTRKVFKNNKEVTLTLKEFGLLEYLMRNPNQVISRDDLLDHNWDFVFDSFSNVVDVHVKNLRKKIDTIDVHGNNTLIETVRGVGYRLKV